MDNPTESLLNPGRPPVFCPGCSHERVVAALDNALSGLSLSGGQVAIVSDIGCSGLFDTFFNTHALHGLHGRALTYGTGLKLARPELNVIVTMGDGGMGIGGAHFLSACRRNLNITLLVLNNFNYGMTGGQCSATTPRDAQVGSGFLNRLEKPLDICRTAAVAGAAWARRVSAYDAGLAEQLQAAIVFDGFAVMDIQGACTGRYTRKNRLTPKVVDEQLATLPALDGLLAENARPEYGQAYRAEAANLKPASWPENLPTTCTPPDLERREIAVYGGAGQRIVTAGELLCLAAASAGLHATQKNDYPITVMRGHSVSEMILSRTPIRYTGIDCPDTVLALGQEGVNRRKAIFAGLDPDALVLCAAGVEAPETPAQVIHVDFKAMKLRSPDWALGALAILAGMGRGVTPEMLDAALALRFKGPVLDASRKVVSDAAGWRAA